MWWFTLYYINYYLFPRSPKLLGIDPFVLKVACLAGLYLAEANREEQSAEAL